MNNLSYWLARIYYRLIGISVNPIPTTFKAEYWAERIFRFITGLPGGLSGGKPVQFWLENWFYSVTGQSHRLATGTQAAWFWLSKLYAHYAGLPLDGMLVPASDEFWASKLLEVVSGSAPPPPVGSPEMRVVIDAGTVADGGTVDVGTVDVGSTLQKTVTIYNDGDADLVVTSPPVTGGDVTAGAISGTTITPGNNATFTLTVSTSTPGSKSGTVSIANNDFDENPYNWTVTATVNNTYVYFVTNTLQPNRWHRMRETSGTTEPNAANPGTNNATISGCTLNQNGQLGAGEAYSWDAVDDFVQMPQASDINGKLPATWIILLNVASRGEASSAFLFSKANDVTLQISSSDASSPFTVIGTANLSISGITQTWNNVLPVSTWTMLAMRINSDLTMDLFVNGTIQTTSAAGSGTKASNTNPMYVGNNAAQARTLDGLVDEVIMDDSAYSDADMLTLAQLAGLA